MLRTVKDCTTHCVHSFLSTSRPGAVPTMASYANVSGRWPSSSRPLAIATPQIRTFFNFKLPSLEMEKTVDMYKVVSHTPEQMYQVVAEVEKYDQFLPFCCRSTVLRQHSPDKFDAQLTVGFKVFQEKYTSRVQLDPEALLVKAELLDSDLFSRMDSTWHLQPTKDPSQCRIVFHVEFAMKSALHAAAINTVFEDLSKQQMAAFVRRAESLRSRRQLDPSLVQTLANKSHLNGRPSTGRKNA